ncbi:MAG: hypothetical protein PHP95_16255 [Desulfuromonadaceae bacterium]|nr:hypothetical protein [Desulfuromonadaceae bacterium]MDD2850004.1 hypothetical protein [Desulfuromonadaceae bacterium]MDD4129830.1 hypothetical protein [Desulfuromonadaceae bacterium]
MEILLHQLQESLLAHGRPAQIAFHIFEILSEAGYNDELIEEVSAALTDIVA